MLKACINSNKIYIKNKYPVNFARTAIAASFLEISTCNGGLSAQSIRIERG